MVAGVYPPLAEASDPTTPGERLRDLLAASAPAVRRAAMCNPNLPGELLRRGLQEGLDLAYLRNPSVPLLVLVEASPELSRGVLSLVLGRLIPGLAQAQRRLHPERNLDALDALIEGLLPP